LFNKIFAFLFAALSSTLLLSNSLSPIVLSAHTGNSKFVSYNGTQFMYNNNVFNVGGTNNHYLGWASHQEVDNVLTDAASLKFNVVRTFISSVVGSIDKNTNEPDGVKKTIWNWNKNGDPSNLGMEGTYFIYWDKDKNAPAYNDGPNGLEKIDYLISQASTHNIKLLLSFNDFHFYTGGMQQMGNWYNPAVGFTKDGKNHQDNYNFVLSDSRVKADYEAWILHLLNHVNTITHVAYKDDPTIFGWDLANEPAADNKALLQQWIMDLSAFVKQNDTNHLLTTGDEGYLDSQSGDDPAAELAYSNIDFGTWHMYPGYHNLSINQVNDLIATHCSIAKVAKKPVLFEEFGFSAKIAIPTQLSAYTQWTNTLLNNPDCSGFTFWRLVSLESFPNNTWLYPRDNGEGFDVNKDMSIANLLQASALAIESRGSNIIPQTNFLKGINFNGNALTINGNPWLSYADALTQGLSLSIHTATTISINPSPTTDGSTGTMLNSLVYPSTGNLTINQSLANGNYQIYIWEMEGYRSNSRNFNLNINNVQMAVGLGNQLLGQWHKYGPYPVTINDSPLKIDLIRVSNRPMISGLEIYKTN